MALDEQSLINEVRGLTDYPPEVISDSDMSSLVETAKNDITGITENYDLDWYDPQDIDPNRALMWTTCLFAKVKSGELDAASMSLESIEIDSTRAAGIQTGKNPVLWYNRAVDFVSELKHEPDESDTGAGITQVERGNRVYGSGSSSGGIGGN